MNKTTNYPVPNELLSLHPSWWRLSATASLRVAKDRDWDPDVAVDDASWIGQDWNGRSNIKLRLESNYFRDAGASPSYQTVTAVTAKSIIKVLSHGIVANNVQVSKLPNHKSVRTNRCERFQSSTLVIDIDFGEFILPLEVSADFLADNSDLKPADIGAGMMVAVLKAHAIRDRIAETEFRLRTTLQERAQLSGVIPLWFRMMPWRFDGRQKPSLSNTYDMAVLMLDEYLRPILSRRLTGSVADIERYLGFHGTTQRRRATNRWKLKATASAGLVTEVALGLIQARGMNVLDVLNSLSVSRLYGGNNGLHHITASTRETLTFVEGVLDATIEFNGGNYAAGKLTLDGDYPRTLVMAAKRRPMTSFVDHPAFRAAGITIKEARDLGGRLRLYHTVLSIPIENAAAQARTDATQEDS